MGKMNSRAKRFYLTGSKFCFLFSFDNPRPDRRFIATTNIWTGYVDISKFSCRRVKKRIVRKRINKMRKNIMWKT